MNIEIYKHTHTGRQTQGMISTKRVPNNHEPPGIHIGLRTKPPAATRAANHTKTKHKRKTAYVWRHQEEKHGQDAPVSGAHTHAKADACQRAHIRMYMLTDTNI